MNIKTKLLPAFMSLVLALGLCPAPALAAGGESLAGAADALRALSGENIASGTSGTCTWVIDGSGKLTVRPTSGSVGTLGEWDFEYEVPWHGHRKDIRSAAFEGAVKARTCCDMFDGCSSLASLDLSGLDTSEVTDMGLMFCRCSSLASLDLSGLDTSKVTRMFGMFEYCSSLTSLNLPGLDTSSVTNVNYMFLDCSSFASLDLSGLDTSKVTYMKNMFSGCSSLATVYAGGGWTTRSVSVSDGMFEGCSSIVGGNGTRYDENHVDAAYARIDADGVPGYFTDVADYGKTSISGAQVTLEKTSSVYTGASQQGSVKGVLLNGVELKEGDDYTVRSESGVDVGSYAVTVVGRGAYRGSAVATFTITKAASSVSLAPQTRTYTGKPLAYTGKVTRSGSAGAVGYSYYSDAACKRAVTAANVKAAGAYYVKATLAADANHKAAASAPAKFTVAKAANPMKVAAKSATAKYSKKKATAVKASAAYKFSKRAAGKVTYSRVAKGSSKWLPKVNAKTGAITVKAGAPKGKVQKVNVKVTAKGDANHKSASKTVTVKVKVK